MPPLASRLVASALVLLSTQRGAAQEATPNVSLQGNRNLLAHEKSPYLVQHATNPVHWMPWGEAAFEKARTQNKPIFLSIGYSTCHWCHVMAHESFEDEATAALLNQSFVCIKVDREERPDVDRLYMSYVQATTGSGGWPMSVWLTPDLHPFFGGTYFPPADRFNRPGFPSLLKRITEAWGTDRPRIVESAAATLASLAESAQPPARSGALSGAVLEAGFQSLVQQYDAEHGGFAKAPKFPRPATLFFLLQHASLAGAQAQDGKIAAGMALHTLRNMYLGGMHDQLGGGFHRYSVDRLWHVPHYEKMLYDQAQLVCAYLEAHQLTGDALCAEAARSTLDYVAREMTDPTGGFHSAEDADSLFAHGKPEHGEGAYYVWTSGEIDSLLGTHSTFFKQVYAVEPEGNSPAGSDPHGELKGKNTLVRRRSPAEAAALSSLEETASEALLFNCREKLLAARAQRPHPHRDDKILTAWNGLMISAFARGYAVLGQEAYLTAARNAALFVQSTLWKNDTLRRSYRKGPGEVPGFSEDYAFLIQGLLDLFEADFQPQWLSWALDLQRVQDRLFWDASGGGYFSSAAGDAAVLIRMKEDHDGAEPAASSVAARNLQRLAEFTGRADLRERASKTVQAFGAVLERAPAALPQMLQSLSGLQTPWRQIVIAGDLSAPDTRALLAVVRRAHLPNTILLHAGSASGTKQLGERLEAASQMPALGGRATAYVCKDFTCQAPVCEPEALEALLKK
jgi:uncharacterized protein YyaL (SSP411 family)